MVSLNRPHHHHHHQPYEKDALPAGAADSSDDDRDMRVDETVEDRLRRELADALRAVRKHQAKATSCQNSNNKIMINKKQANH